MKVQCDYCRQMIDDGLDKCPNCGAAITKNRMADEQPKTIEELKQWYKDHNLPPEETTRFFIGKSVKEPKAFGIYKDSNDGDFVVYKNKANGERAIRYRGSDEAYAVNELYQRLKSEIADQKENSAKKSEKKQGNSKGKDELTGIPLLDNLITIVLLPFVSPVFATIYLVIAFIILCLFDHSPSKGYYSYNGNDYYHQGSSWYAYDADNDSWFYASNSDELNDAINDKTDADYQTYSHTGQAFEDTTWYDSGTSDDSSDWDSDSSWSSSSSWDSGSSWDSSSSDWDSDW